MAKNVLQSTILSGAGAVAIAPGAQIEVRSPSGLLVPLWLDRDGTQPTTNPTTADSDGFFRVYLNSGRYHITARSGGESREWRDVLLGSAAGYDVDDMLAALAAGVYTSVADGLANTAEGDFFWVAHETGEDVLTLYRVVDGDAELWAALPRGDVVRELTARAESAAEAAEADAQAAQDALDAILALGDLPSAVAAAEQAAQSASASATAAATSESTASAAATAAEQAAQRAEDAAADTGLPSPIVPLSFLQAKADGSGYQAVGDEQMLNALGIPAGKPTADPATPITGSLLSGAMLAAGAIVEMGTNANGSYWRWESGLQVCMYVDPTTHQLTGTSAPLYWGTVNYTFPAAFAEIPAISPTVHDTATGVFWGGSVQSVLTKTYFLFQAIGNTAGSEYKAMYVAIGRWK